jgi:predicted Co/Zn/Cd cation transporter (cation efflux family)
MKNPLIIHPFLFSMFGVLVPIVANIHSLGYTGIESLIIAQFITLLLIIVIRIVIKEPQNNAFSV